MKKLKKLLLAFLMAVSVLPTASSCGTNGVTIKRIYVEEDNNQDIRYKKRDLGKKASVIASGTDYIIIDEGQSEISLTVEVKNPKNERISSMIISSDDANAEIMENGIFEPINQEDGRRVISWHGENLYKTTYTIRLFSDKNVNTIRIEDIKLDGHTMFQSEELRFLDLGNNKLDIYKMGENSFGYDIKENSFDKIILKPIANEEYNNTISNLEFKDTSINLEGYYEFTNDSSVILKMDYQLNNDITINIEIPIEIKILKINPSDHGYTDAISDMLGLPDNCHIMGLGFLGTDLINSIEMYYKDEKVEILHIWEYDIVYKNPANYDINLPDNSIMDETYEDIGDKLGNFKFIINNDEYKLQFVTYREPSLDRHGIYHITGLSIVEE